MKGIKGVDLAKKYGKNWVFRNLNFEAEEGKKTAILGKNGSGKSTLIQIIAGYLTPSKGQMLLNGKPFEPQDVQIGFIGPYTEVIEEFTFRELLNFHSQFKTSLISFEEMAEQSSLPLDKPIADFSTGMKQRVKLSTIFYFENELIFMDEPTSNLDEEGFQWWKTATENIQKKTIFIASNDKNEIALCEKQISL